MAITYNRNNTNIHALSGIWTHDLSVLPLWLATSLTTTLRSASVQVSEATRNLAPQDRSLKLVN
jgi:hypothetical protein